MLTVNQAAELLDITPSLIRRYCRQGRLRATKIGRDWLIDQLALDSFSKEDRATGRPRMIKADADKSGGA